VQHNNVDDSAWSLKIARADEHIADLRELVDVYLSSGAYRLKPERDQGVSRLRLHIDRQPPPQWSPIIGDALHNLRSALDARVVAVARDLVDRDLTDDEERPLALPLTTRHRDFRRATRQWSHALGEQPAATLVRIVSHLQRFGDPSPWRSEHLGIAGDADDAAHLHNDLVARLLRLGRLSNVDKHRRVHVALVAIGGLGGWGDVTGEHWWVEPGPLRDGEIIARVTVPAGHTFGDLSGWLRIGLPDTPVTLGLADDLDNLRYFTNEALDVIGHEARLSASR
jgi:hypothetical protein